jgi:polyphosphate kinase 2 (PPK2 family)|tara:strand:+ start:194 stop:301 length:108 start_codon:yes stop_codon:yes gene_type:complete
MSEQRYTKNLMVAVLNFFDRSYYPLLVSRVSDFAE